MLVGPNFIEFDLRTDGFLEAIDRIEWFLQTIWKIEWFLGTAGTTTNEATAIAQLRQFDYAAKIEMGLPTGPSVMVSTLSVRSLMTLGMAPVIEPKYLVI